ncbi:MAG: carbohydrate binding domain-containing protein [Acidobacteriota bacterium]|nr:carbohydrate binding domain-containing protein [Acidobacteriota bacterium]
MRNIVGRKNLKRTIFLFSFMFAFCFAAESFAQTSAVLENNFEKGTDRWETRGTASVGSSKEQAASGTKSLRVTGRTTNWHGAQLNVTKILAGGQVYKFSAAVRLAKGENPDEIKMTMQRGDNQYETVGTATANADGWTTVSGNFKPSGRDSSLLVYIEAGRANTAYFIDDFKIESLGDGTPKQSGVILQNDFEDQTAQNWFVRGDEAVQMFSSNAGGSQNLRVGGRTQSWHGLAVDVSPLFFKGRTYEISVSARLVKGQPVDSLRIVVQQTPPKGQPKIVEVSSPIKVTDSEWVTLSGRYTATTSDNNILVCIEAAGAGTSFHIDNFTIKVPAEGDGKSAPVE